MCRNLSFPPVPKGFTIRKMWLCHVGCENLKIKRTATVCSRNFMLTDVIQGGAWIGGCDCAFCFEWLLSAGRKDITRGWSNTGGRDRCCIVVSVPQSQFRTRTSSFGYCTSDFYGFICWAFQVRFGQIFYHQLLGLYIWPLVQQLCIKKTLYCLHFINQTASNALREFANPFSDVVSWHSA